MACITPFSVKKDTTGETIPVPCGKCPECLKRRVSGWSFRLMQEEKQSETAMFLTLTYDTQHVPITNKGYMSLDKRDCQLFFKRLRKTHTNAKPIKYYLAGEYGGRTNRPHYHIIMFNADLTKIQPAWPKGQIHYGDVNGASVGYTLKYISKPRRFPLHQNDDRIPEFALMSKGLGANYLTSKIRTYHLTDMDNRMNIILPDGKVISMPRYYKDKLYTEEQRKRIAFFSRKKMLLDQQEKEDKERLEFGNDYYKVITERDHAKFNKMNKNAKQRDTL